MTEIIPTKEHPGAFDIMAEAKAETDEPKITFWARDPEAPAAILHWVELRRKRIGADESMTAEKREEELKQCTDAEMIAWAMDEWRKGLTPVAADTLTFDSYAGNVIGEDEALAKARFDTLITGAAKIENARADLNDTAEAIGPLGHSEEAEALVEVVKKLAFIAESFRPKRRSYAHLA